MPRRNDPPTVAGSGGFWLLITPAAGVAIDPSGAGRPCDAVYMSALGQITGKCGARGAADVATASPPLAPSVPHPLRFFTIDSITGGGSVWAIWYEDPLATNS